MFKVPVEKHGVNSHLRQKGKIAELALGYGGSVGALKAMGALEIGLAEEELPGLVSAWRASNPHIVRLWWDVDKAAGTAVRERTVSESTASVSSAKRNAVYYPAVRAAARLCEATHRHEPFWFRTACLQGSGPKRGNVGKLRHNSWKTSCKQSPRHLCDAMRRLDRGG
jgi:DNA polymerase